MYNQYSYNSQPLGYTSIPVQFTQDSIVFDGYSLQSSNIITSRIDYDNQGEIELNSFKYPRSDGGGVLSKYYRGRVISIDCTIKGSTSSEFEALIDTTKKKLRNTEGYLDIRVGTEIRRIKATLTKFDAGRQHYNVTFAKVSIEFTALEPFFYALQKQSYEFLGNTSSFAGEIQNEGSVESLPTFYFVGTAGCNISQVVVTYAGKNMTIPVTITQNDVLILDCENKDINKNGNPVDYTGFFPIFSTGSCPFTVTTTGTTALDLTLVMNKNYL